ncbi:MAG TPA: FtsQ-type POTRA domain-containing protein, partial [Anaerolineae bacterium]|nr:FtsQ-type POTRA domain-containing protein [Anaerolineae bacterium]
MTKQQARLKSRSHFRQYESNAMLVGSLRSTPRISLSSLTTTRSISGALLAIVIGLALWLAFDDRFYVSSITVTGNVRVDAATIVEKSGVLGQHIFWMQPQAVAQQLVTALPSVRSAEMTCTFPADCTLSVEERQPIVAWQYGSAVTWIDADRVAFAAEGKSAGSLITIEAVQGPALFPGQRADQQLIEAAVAVARAMPTVQHYRYTAKNGLEFDDPRGFPVYLGLGSNMADRVMIWQALRAELTAKNILPKFVDVRYP